MWTATTLPPDLGISMDLKKPFHFLNHVKIMGTLLMYFGGSQNYSFVIVTGSLFPSCSITRPHTLYIHYSHTVFGLCFKNTRFLPTKPLIFVAVSIFFIYIHKYIYNFSCNSNLFTNGPGHIVVEKKNFILIPVRYLLEQNSNLYKV